MKRKMPTLILTLLLSLALFAGCSSSQDAAPGKSADDGMYGGASTTQARSEAENTGGAAPDAAPERKIIRNASVELETVDVQETYDVILAHAVALGGYESHRTWNRWKDSIRIEAQIRIAPEHLDELVDFAEQSGTALSSNIRSDNITEEYYDTQTRLRTMEEALDQYYAFMEDAVSIEELLQVQSEIDRLTMEIESLKGRLQLWDSMLEESVLTLVVVPVTDPVEARRDIDWSALSFSDMGYLIRLGFTRVGNVIVSGAQWFVIVLVAASPIWVAGIAVILVLRHRRKKRRAAVSDTTAPQQTEDDPSQESDD